MLFYQKRLCSIASSLTSRWPKLLSFLIRHQGNLHPPIFNTTNRFLPAHPTDWDWLDTAFQSYWRQMGREKKAWEKQGVTELAQVLSHFSASIELTDHQQIYLTLNLKVLEYQTCLVSCTQWPQCCVFILRTKHQSHANSRVEFRHFCHTFNAFHQKKTQTHQITTEMHK